MMALPATVYHHRGRPWLRIDPQQCTGPWGQLALPLGASRYEARWGTGTAGGTYPCAPSRPLPEGTPVRCIRIARVIERRDAPAWAAKIYILDVALDVEEETRLATERAAAEERAALTRQLVAELTRVGHLGMAEDSDIAAIVAAMRPLGELRLGHYVATADRVAEAGRQTPAYYRPECARALRSMIEGRGGKPAIRTLTCHEWITRSTAPPTY